MVQKQNCEPHAGLLLHSDEKMSDENRFLLKPWQICELHGGAERHPRLVSLGADQSTVTTSRSLANGGKL